MPSTQVADFFKPNRGWLWAVGAVIADRLFDRYRTPEWMEWVSLVICIAALALWPWISRRRKRRNAFWNLFVVWSVAVVGTSLYLRQQTITIMQAQEQTLGARLKAKYPLGYVIFDVDHENRVIPYASREFLDSYDLDWSVVRVTPISGGTHVEIQLPNMTKRAPGGPSGLSDIKLRIPQIVGWDKAGVFVGNLLVRAEILAIRDFSTVFVVGLSQIELSVP